MDMFLEISDGNRLADTADYQLLSIINVWHCRPIDTAPTYIGLPLSQPAKAMPAKQPFPSDSLFLYSTGRDRGMFRHQIHLSSHSVLFVTAPFFQTFMSLLAIETGRGRSPVFPFLSLGLFKMMIILTSSMISVVINCDNSLSSGRRGKEGISAEVAYTPLHGLPTVRFPTIRRFFPPLQQTACWSVSLTNWLHFKWSLSIWYSKQTVAEHYYKEGKKKSSYVIA